MSSARLFLLAFLCWTLSACRVPEQQPAPPSLPFPSTPVLTSTPSFPQPILLWSYADSRRLGLELLLRNYPLPPGFETLCPFTAVDLVQGEQAYPLYRNPEQISLDEFYDRTRHFRWYCFQEQRRNADADYRLSLTFFPDETAPLASEGFGNLRIALGQVTATNQVSAITLPDQGEFSLPFAWVASDSHLTWESQPALQAKGFIVTLQRLFVNPSVSWLDACLTYADHHSWEPVAHLEINGHSARSLTWWLLTPFNPPDAETILQSTSRCFAFTIPFHLPGEEWEKLQVGVEQVRIERDDSLTLTDSECRTAAETVMRQIKETHIQCIEFERNGKRHHWFEIVAYPGERSREEIYQAMLSLLSKSIVGNWYWQLEH